MSTFGGPEDTGVGPDEGLALVDDKTYEGLREYFLPQQPPGTTGLARRLNPDKFYIACRWDYKLTPKRFLRQSMVRVTNLLDGKTAQAKPVDWGPNVKTKRVADLSPGLAAALALETDDEVEVTLEQDIRQARAGKPSALPGVFSEKELASHFGAFDYTDDPHTQGAIIIEPKWKANNLITILIPALVGVDYGGKKFSGKVQCHRKIAKDLEGAFAEMQRQNLADRIISFSGSWVPRHINWNPANPLSSHSWGVALDINKAWNERGRVPAAVGSKGSVRELVAIFESFGFYWGGKFKTPDGMHFEYARVPADT
jgi:hypothetical protein